MYFADSYFCGAITVENICFFISVFDESTLE